MCCCRNRTRDAEAVRQTKPDTPLVLLLDPADGHRRLTIISKQEATNLTTSVVFAITPMAHFGHSVM